MHPQVIEEEPGQCPICGMNLVPLREDIGHGDGDGHGDGLWTCPMHPEVLEEEPGSCPICGMDLVEVKEEVGHGDGDGIRLRPEGYAGTSGYGEREILFYRNPMDPDHLAGAAQGQHGDGLRPGLRRRGPVRGD